MKPLKHVWPLLLALSLGVARTTHAQQYITNRLTASARFGFNISARFKGVNTLPQPVSTRTTPQGDAYNYDDGYVLTDFSGNFGGETWYWGYDDSSRQVSGNNILLSRSSLAGGAPSATLQDEPSYGGEVVYNRLLGTKNGLRYGLEIAGNYLNLSLSDSRTFAANVMRTTYPFAFRPGTTPPIATPSAPYQGSFGGPGIVISDTPGSPTTTITRDAIVQGHRQFDADVWGCRLGPYLDLPFSKQIKVSLSAGLAGAWLDGNGSWSESASIGGVRGASVSGTGHAGELLWGFYAAGNVSWQFSEHWSAVAGAQYQNLSDYNHSFGGRQVEVDMSNSVFATVGLSFNF